MGLRRTLPTRPNAEHNVKLSLPARDAASPDPNVRRRKMSVIIDLIVEIRLLVIFRIALLFGRLLKSRLTPITVNLTDGSGDFPKLISHPQSDVNCNQTSLADPIVDILSMVITSSTQCVEGIANSTAMTSVHQAAYLAKFNGEVLLPNVWHNVLK